MSDSPARGGLGIPPGIRYMAASAFFFSVMALLVKVAGRRLPTQEVVLGRAVVSLALSYIAVRRAGVSPWGNDRKLLVLRGLLGFGALSFFYYALVHLPLADATVIHFTHPVIAALIAVKVLNEKVGPGEAATVLLCMVGVLMVARPSFLFGASAALDPVAVGVALAGAAFSGGAYVTVRRLRATEHPMVIVFYFALISVVGSLPGAAAVAVWPTPLEWLTLAGVGVATQLGQVFVTRGLHLERAGRATAIGYLQIVLAALWGTMFFGEVPHPTSLLGAALIVGGTLAFARRAATTGQPA